MKIYDYSSIGNVFLGSNVSSFNGSFFNAVVNYLQTGAEIEIHPKEIERQQRMLKRRKYITHLTSQSKTYIGGNGLYNNSVIIINGNTGFGTKPIESFIEELKTLNDVLEKNNCHIIFVRGNMDDPSYFNEHKIDFSNIKLVEDYSVIKLIDFNCLCVGGSVSIDREWKKSQADRLNKPMYWENEKTEFNETAIDEILSEMDIACIVTNDAPSFVSDDTSSYKNSKWATTDKDITKDMIAQRVVMDKIYSKFVMTDKKPYVWAYSANCRMDSVFNRIVFDSIDGVGGEMVNLNSLVNSHFGVSIGGYSKGGKKIKFKKATSSTYTEPILNMQDIGWRAEEPVGIEENHIDRANEDVIGGMALDNTAAQTAQRDFEEFRRRVNEAANAARIAQPRNEGRDGAATLGIANPANHNGVAIANPEEPNGVTFVNVQPRVALYDPINFADDWQ